jgi:hypothetical protein
MVDDVNLALSPGAAIARRDFDETGTTEGFRSSGLMFNTGGGVGASGEPERRPGRSTSAEPDGLSVEGQASAGPASASCLTGTTSPVCLGGVAVGRLGASCGAEASVANGLGEAQPAGMAAKQPAIANVQRQVHPPIASAVLPWSGA